MSTFERSDCGDRGISPVEEHVADRYRASLDLLVLRRRRVRVLGRPVSTWPEFQERKSDLALLTEEIRDLSRKLRSH